MVAFLERTAADIVGKEIGGKVLPPLYLPERFSLSECQNGLQQHFEDLEVAFKLSLLSGKLLHWTSVNLRKKIIEEKLPNRGLIHIGDNYWTGWFLVKCRDGKIYSAFRGPHEGIPAYTRLTFHSLFFIPDLEQARELDFRFRFDYLDEDDLIEMKKLCKIELHPLHQALCVRKLEESVLSNDIFLGGLEARQNDFAENQAEYIRMVLLELMIRDNTSRIIFSRAVSEVKVQMRTVGWALFRLYEGLWIVAVRNSEGVVYFQDMSLSGARHAEFRERYLALGKVPTVSELKTLTQSLNQPLTQAS